MRKKIAITGGIGSGKSHVAKYIKNLGYPVFSCDEIYKELCQTSLYVQKVQSIFPEAVRGNAIDKKKLAQIVFSNKEQLNQLNSLAHPLIMEKLHQEMDVAMGDVVFAEVPLLFEGGYEKDFDETFFVKRNLSSRVQGIIQRDKIGEDEAFARIRNQIDIEQVKAKICDENLIVHFIENNDTLEELEKQINQILQNLNA